MNGRGWGLCTILASLTFFSAAAPRASGPGGTEGNITLSVDATEAARRIFHARLAIPVRPGPLTLLYPKYIPGEHAPTGPITDLVGLKLAANGQPLSWDRDLVDMYTFHCLVPAGVTSLEISLDYLSATATEGFSSGASATSQLAVLNWNQLLLYPAGVDCSKLTYQATLRLPVGWKYGTALPVAKDVGNVVDFIPVSLFTLVDSPVNMGAHFRVVDLTPGASPSHEIDLAGDSEAAIQMKPELIESYKRLVAETGKLFGARHYGHYHFLYTLSDHITSTGIEHHESSDNRLPERTLLDEALHRDNADLLPHEMTHSWNGKYRRPADLTTPDFQQPMKTDLLWTYEGLTQFLGDLLAVRSGLWTPEEYREQLARLAASMSSHAGRTWRPLSDTAVAAQLLYAARPEWRSWRRGADFYAESSLIWLEADTIIRRESHGAKSIDDFCRAFHGGTSGSPTVSTYTFEDLVRTLDQLARADWKSFFHERLTSLAPTAPIGGIEASGWNLVYTDVPNKMIEARETGDKLIDLSYSIGVLLTEEGVVQDVIPGKPAAEAGVAPGMKLLGVNGRHWSKNLLHLAVKNTKGSEQPLELTLENDEFLKTFRLDYHDGERYPHLERAPDRPDVLSQIITPLAK